MKGNLYDNSMNGNGQANTGGGITLIDPLNDRLQIASPIQNGATCDMRENQQLNFGQNNQQNQLLLQNLGSYSRLQDPNELTTPDQYSNIQDLNGNRNSLQNGLLVDPNWIQSALGYNNQISRMNLNNNNYIEENLNYNYGQNIILTFQPQPQPQIDQNSLNQLLAMQNNGANPYDYHTQFIANNAWAFSNFQPTDTRQIFSPRIIERNDRVKINNTVQGIDNKHPKPVFSYSCLIAMALKNSESGSLPVNEIYKYMQENFPYFKTAPEGWKNSVRHNLSLNKAFQKMIRSDTTNTQRKGCLWTLKPEKRKSIDREIRKWFKKHPEAIRRSMNMPENFENYFKNQQDDSADEASAPDTQEGSITEANTSTTLQADTNQNGYDLTTALHNTYMNSGMQSNINGSMETEDFSNLMNDVTMNGGMNKAINMSPSYADASTDFGRLANFNPFATINGNSHRK